MELLAKAIIFDLDGVLANSIAMLAKAYTIWSNEHGFDVEAVIAATHGRRKPEIIASVAPHLNAEKEIEKLVEIEESCLSEVVPIPGAADFVNSLPPGSWAIATSGERHGAEERLRHVGIPIPSTLIAAEDVVLGKPHPECYLKAAAGIGADPLQCVMFEDAPLGIEAGLAAGMRAIGVSTTFPESALHRAMFVLRDLRSARAVVNGEKLKITLGD